MTSVEVRLPEAVSRSFEKNSCNQTLEQLEQLLLKDHHSVCQKLASDLKLVGEDWLGFVIDLKQIWQQNDYVVVRSQPVTDGNAALLLSLAFNSRFKAYRGEKVLKHFKVSPWTNGLSQTLKEGHFHTDICTSETPPRITVIQCRVADPSLGKGILRVARLKPVLEELKRRGANDTLNFLLNDKCELVDDRAGGSYRGLMINGDTIRYHPETLRAAYRRKGLLRHSLEQHIATIHDVALMNSHPINLQSGDTLLVSNVRALHYRSECSVRFLEFPRNYEAREIYVLHLLDEPLWTI